VVKRQWPNAKVLQKHTCAMFQLGGDLCQPAYSKTLDTHAVESVFTLHLTILVQDCKYSPFDKKYCQTASPKGEEKQPSKLVSGSAHTNSL